MKQGIIIEAKVYDQNETDFLAQKDGHTLKIHKETSEGPVELGDMVEGMYYIDQQGEARLAISVPHVRLDYYDWGTVVLKRTDIGVFVDIGLYNKDIAVSSDILPLNTDDWPLKGDKIFIKLSTDNKGRLWGDLADSEKIKSMTHPAPERIINQDIQARVYRLLESGYQVYCNEGFDGFVHESESIRPLRLGELIEGRVIDRHSDGRINISLRPRAHEAINDDARMILTLLEKIPSHQLPYTDKSDPEEIKHFFGISKGQFKRAIGHLLKNKLIRQKKGEFIELITGDTV